jgi:antitoxin component YwqK of YwqJK toxin-antitoxin module
VGGASLPVGNEYLIYTSGEGNNFGCCSICDEWTKKVSMTESVQSELKILRQFAKIFDHKKSGKYDFYYSNGHLAATGQFKNGSATGHWKHFYENDTLKSFYDFECNIITQYSKNGFIMTESNTSENVSISKNYSIKDNGKLEYKFIDTKTDTGSFLQVYEYHDNGNLKEIHGQININIKGGSTSTGREGVYEEYYENGNLNVRGEYKKGRRIGIWTWYYEDGSYNTKYDYKDGATPQ